MKKILAVLVIVIMLATLSGSAFAYGQQLTAAEAGQIAMNYAGVNSQSAVCTKNHQDYENGRLVYELEFYAGDRKYEMHVDALTGAVTDYETEYIGGYSQPAYNGYNQPAGNNYSPPAYNAPYCGGWDDWDDWDD